MPEINITYKYGNHFFLCRQALGNRSKNNLIQLQKKNVVSLTVFYLGKNPGLKGVQALQGHSALLGDLKEEEGKE